MQIRSVQRFNSRVMQLGGSVTTSFLCPCAPLVRLVCFEVTSDNLTLILCGLCSLLVRHA
jgi:hypothetical protein